MCSSINIQRIVNSIYNSNSYILTIVHGEDIESWIIDVGDVNRIIECIPKHSRVVGVLFTHTHYDHIYGLNELLSIYPYIRLITNEIGKRALCSPRLNYSKYHQEAKDIICSKPENIETIKDGDVLSIFDNYTLQVVSTPGHDKSCLTFLFGDYVFSGDSFIPGIKTRTSFLLSDKYKVKESEQKIITYAMHKTLCPGHGPIYINYTKQ